MNDLRERGNYPLENSPIQPAGVKYVPGEPIGSFRYVPTTTFVETHAVPEKGWTVTTVTAAPVKHWSELDPIEQVDYWSKAIHEATQHLRQISEQMQAARNG
jgi:hypothetical protein